MPVRLSVTASVTASLVDVLYLLYDVGSNKVERFPNRLPACEFFFNIEDTVWLCVCEWAVEPCPKDQLHAYSAKGCFAGLVDNQNTIETDLVNFFVKIHTCCLGSAAPR